MIPLALKFAKRVEGFWKYRQEKALDKSLTEHMCLPPKVCADCGLKYRHSECLVVKGAPVCGECFDKRLRALDRIGMDKP